MIVKVMRPTKNAFYDCWGVNTTDNPNGGLDILLHLRRGIETDAVAVTVEDKKEVRVFLMNDDGKTIEKLW